MPHVNTSPAKPATPTKRGNGKKTKPAAEARPAVYPELDCLKCLGKNALTVDRIKEILGWEAEPPEGGFGEDYLAKDRDGRKFRCTNNVQNREFDERWCEALMYDMLNGNWQVNGESIILSCYGEVHSGQHRLIAAVWAEQERNGKNAAHWEEKHPKPITLEAFVNVGISADPRVTRTLDNVKPRTLSDVLYCDGDLFRNKPRSERSKLVKVLDFAVRNLWDRTAAAKDPFHPRRTHSESLEYIAKHKRVKDVAVKHIYEEDGSKGIHKLIGQGTAAALLYLMAGSTTDRDEWWNSEDRSDKFMSFDRLDKAKEFWSIMCREFPPADMVKKTEKNDKEREWTRHADKTVLREIRRAIAACGNPEDGRSASKDEKLAIIIKAWCAWIAGHKVTVERLALRRDEETNELLERPSVGGIDLPVDDDDDEGREVVQPDGAGADDDGDASSGDDPTGFGDRLPSENDGSEELPEGGGPEAGDPSPERIEAMKEHFKANPLREKAAAMNARIRARQQAGDGYSPRE